MIHNNLKIIQRVIAVLMRLILWNSFSSSSVPVTWDKFGTSWCSCKNNSYLMWWFPPNKSFSRQGKSRIGMSEDILFYRRSSVLNFGSDHFDKINTSAIMLWDKYSWSKEENENLWRVQILFEEITKMDNFGRKLCSQNYFISSISFASRRSCWSSNRRIGGRG